MSNWNARAVVTCPYCDKALEVIVHEPDSYTRAQRHTCQWCKKSMMVEYHATVEAKASKEADEKEPMMQPD